MSRTVDVREAKTHLSRLPEAVETPEDLIAAFRRDTGPWRSC